MAITLTGTGGLFTRLGKLFMAFRSCNLYSGDVDLTGSSSVPDALGTSYVDILAQFATNETELMAGLSAQRDSARTGLAAWKSYLIQLADAQVILQADRDVTLVSKDRKTAWTEVIKQMVGGGSLAGETSADDVDASTVSISLAAATTLIGANTGNATLTGSVKRPDSRQNQLVFAETIELFCASDDQTDGAGRAETWSVLGEVAQDPLDFRWPDGSGANTTITTVDALQDNSGGNLLTNSSFETFTANVPNNWTRVVGVAGTTLDDEASIIYGTHGAKALKITGDAGGTLTEITQKFNDVAGTAGTLSPGTRYHCNCYVKDSGAGLLAGVITFSLVDAVSDAVLTDDAGNNLSSTLAFGTTTGTYAAKSFTFVTPKALPVNGVKFKIAVTTALTDGESMYIDDLAMAAGAEVYVGGPTLAIFAGSTNPIIGDKYTATVANNYAGDFMQYVDRFFDFKAMGLQLPSDAGAGETILDTLIG